MTSTRTSVGWTVRRLMGVALSCAPPVAAAPAAPEFHAPTPRSAAERLEERRQMVETQLFSPADGRQPVTDAKVLDAMRAVPRHAFVPERVRPHAYADSALPIGHGQTISQPYIVALMTQHLDVTPESKVLEIGTGSGYQAAVLAHLTPRVYSIEIVEPLAKRAAATLKEQGYTTVQTKAGDGYQGWPEHAPFDAIIVTCAPEKVPQPLWDQLKPGGRIVIPVGPARRVQQLVVVTKSEDGQRRTQTITDVQFVPMTGETRRKVSR
jgi:protein-L-isoaspartate(D-aspartate) O-methyltransferase